MSAETKALLDAIKPRGIPFDIMLKWILLTRPLQEWKSLADELASRPVAVAAARRLRNMGAPSVTRRPADQVALANAAQEIWQLWRRSGRARWTGPRAVTYDAEREPKEKRVRIQVVR